MAGGKDHLVRTVHHSTNHTVQVTHSPPAKLHGQDAVLARISVASRLFGHNSWREDLSYRERLALKKSGKHKKRNEDYMLGINEQRKDKKCRTG